MTPTSLSTSRVWDALRDVEDPEFPISIVDLGLVVGVEERERGMQIKLTLTSMGCPGVDMILDDIRARLAREPCLGEVDIKIVWDPIWTKDRISEDGKAQLREWGLSV